MCAQNIDNSKIAGNIKVDYTQYEPLPESKERADLYDTLSASDKAILKQVGVDVDKRRENGGFLLYDNRLSVGMPAFEGLEIMPLQKALQQYPWVREKYYFRAIDEDQDEYTQRAAKEATPGYFIWVKKGVKLELPVHAGLFMHTAMQAMCVHNLVILDEGAHLHLITGCTSGQNTREGFHAAVSEHFVGKNASFVNTMIHNWGPEFVVRPRSATIVEDDGAYVSNYYSMKPAKNIQAMPFTRLAGKNASAKYMTVLACMPDTYCDIGGTVLMSGENARAELVARAVNYGGTVMQTGLLIGAASGTRGHVDCSGLMLSDNGIIEAVPGLRSVHPDARMSHEAAIGKIDMGEVNYLQSKGLDEMQAIALIIRGFLNIGIEIEGLDEELEAMIQQIAELSGHGE